jgi:hypothetical protein
MASTAKLKPRVNRLIVLTLILSGLISWLASTKTRAAQTFVVTTVTDNGDNINPTPGSLRQAIILANNTGGTDTITFQIGNGAQTIQPPSPLPVITEAVIIDGTTQQGFAGAPIIELNGTSAGATAVGLQIDAGGSTVRGLVINRFDRGIFLNSKGGNTIAGCYIGTNITGTAAQGNKSHGIDAQSSSNNTIGGTTTADRNIISGNGNNGVRLAGSSSNIVRGNYIGTDVSGNLDLGNGNQGLRIDNTSGNKIGGTNAGEGNIISGNGDVAVRITSANNNTVSGNRIGTNAAGTGNIGNDQGGVHVYGGTGNVISSNSISFNNNGLGIDLDVDTSAPADGVTPNDINDVDTGSNDLQNFPVVTNVKANANSTDIQGTLNSKANTQYRIEFFASSQCDPSGSGEGQTFLGSADVTTVGNDAAFNVTLPVTIQPSQFITATATDPTGNTSEFSQCASGGATLVQFSQSGYGVQETQQTVDITVTRSGDTSGASSVDYITSDTSGLTPCQTNGNGIASDRCDYATAAGTLRFTAGETSKTISIPIINDAYQEPAESFSIKISNPLGAALGGTITAQVTITSEDNQVATQNPIDDQAFFIRMQYIDFLGRIAEQAGFDFWMNRMNNCPQGDICDRTDTSQRFFQSDEFQSRGFLVYRLYDVTLGRLPHYTEFIPDMARLNGYQTPQEQQQNKDAYLAEFASRQEFKNLYDQFVTADAFVNALCQKAGITPASKQSLIDNLQNGVKDRAHTVEDFINTPEISGVGTKFYDRGFIAMQYFSYLRRDPDQGGFNFWTSQLIGQNAPHKGDYRFMVGGFINSDEYRFRLAKLPVAP